MEAEIIIGLSELGGTGLIPRAEITASIKRSVCQLYLPRTEICSVTELR